MIDVQIDGEAGGVAEQLVLLVTMLGENRLCTVATLTAEQRPHANTAYYAYDEDELELYILTPPSAIHSQSFAADPACAITIFSADQTWDGDHRGLQLTARATIASGAAEARAFARYAERYPQLLTMCADIDELHERLESRLYVLALSRIKLLDETANGSETYTNLIINRH